MNVPPKFTSVKNFRPRNQVIVDAIVKKRSHWMRVGTLMTTVLIRREDRDIHRGKKAMQ